MIEFSSSLRYRPGLDIIRFASALWVMLCHAGAVPGGGHAVTIFFVLSGYLIGGQLLEEKVHRGKIAFKEFYFKRITRIWAPYYIFLIFMIVLFHLRGQQHIEGFYERMYGALTYTYNIINSARGSIHPTWVSANQIWSLSIEEQFYLVIPALISWIPLRGFDLVNLLLIIATLLYAPLYTGLFVGVLLYRMLKIFVKKFSWAPSSRTAVVLSIILWTIIVRLAYSELGQASVVTLAFTALLVVSANFIWVPERFHGGLRKLGLMTYSFYLIHGLPTYFLGAAYRHFWHVTENPLWFNLFCGLLALPLSYAFVQYVEFPILRWRNLQLRDKSRLISLSPAMAIGLSLAGLGIIFFETVLH